MASDKHILIYDEVTGMLTKEVMLAYLYGDLPQKTREEVERFLETDTMHRDIIEGLKQLPDKTQAEKAIHWINEEISAKTGAASIDGGVVAGAFEFLNKYKIAATLAGVLLLSGIVFALLYKNGNFSLPVAETKTERQSEPPEILQPEQQIENQRGDADSSNGLIAQNTDRLNVKEDEETTMISSGAETALPLVISDGSKPDKKKEEAKAETSKEVSKTANGTTSNTTVPADEKDADKNEEAITDIVIKEQKVSAETVMQDDYAKGKLENTTGTKQMAYRDALAIADEMPVFPGGEAAMRQYIKTSLQYPKRERNKGITGKVYINFVIDPAGKVRDVRVIQGADKNLDAEAVRLVKSMPDWTPGKEDGKNVAVKQYLTIEFTPE